MSGKVNALRGWWIVPFLSVASVTAATGDLRVLEAVKSRNTEAVRALLKQRVDVNTSQADGATALHWAAHWDDLDTANLLIRARANVNAGTDLGVTPLSLACSNANAALAEALLKAGANANAALSTGETVLMTCARTGNAEAVKVLLAHDANVHAKEPERGQTALMWAVAQRHPEVVRTLVAHGADVHARSAARLRWHEGHEVREFRYLGEAGGFTPLLFGALHGDVDAARILVEAGANVNDTAADGSNVLALAAHSGHGALGAYLLDRGANPNAAGAGYTALHAAVLRGDADLVKALLAHGADPNARVTRGTTIRFYSHDWGLGNTVGATPFWLAAKFGEVTIMRLLAAEGADPQPVMENGTTPLMMAAGLDWRGGNDRRGRNLPLQATTERQDERRILASVTLAVDLGADVNAVNKDGDTALHGAAAKGLDAVIQFLVNNGARVDVKNKKGSSPLEMALRGGSDVPPFTAFSSAADLLRKLGAKE